MLGSIFRRGGEQNSSKIQFLLPQIGGFRGGGEGSSYNFIKLSKLTLIHFKIPILPLLQFYYYTIHHYYLFSVKQVIIFLPTTIHPQNTYVTFIIFRRVSEGVQEKRPHR
jgi:hypothetical protein